MDPQAKMRYQQEFDDHLRANRFAEAGTLCARLMAIESGSVDGNLLASHSWQRLGDFDSMLRAAQKAYSRDEKSLAVGLRLAECELYCNQVGAALGRLEQLEVLAGDDESAWQNIAQMYLHCASHVEAGRCYERAAALKPDHAGHLYNLASSCVILGDIERAAVLFNRVIALSPDMLDAYLGRTQLQTWDAEANNIAELSGVLARLPARHPGEVPLCHALAKEYEDIGEPRHAVAYLHRGAAGRRATLAYRVETDVNAMAQIRRTFDRKFFSQSTPATKADTADEPSYFVLGLPRSGTTLVDRILSSHSQVASLGEVQNFTFALMHLAGGGRGGKFGLIERSSRIDVARLGSLYRAGILQYGKGAAHLINKTPANYLYLGLIHRALPNAKIVHLRRHPLDSCYAMYKTLFNMGYPFSYSLADIGHYYLAYHRLMQHWREHMPDSFLDVDYETLVDQQESTTRAMLAYCGLPWENSCLEFHKNAAPAASASASQVRQPVYRRSLQRWRDYADDLAPLAAFLTGHGIDCT